MYHSARQLPDELREHCVIYFEEQMYNQALTLFNNLLESGVGSAGPLFVPSPALLGLIATLTVHPSLTTRTHSSDKLAAANQALYFLHHVNKLLGPVNAQFGLAFAFRKQGTSARGRKLNKRQLIKLQDEDDSPESALAETDYVDTDIANDGSLWSKAKDFWHVIGWAFNCSVRRKDRWERWEVWLDFMLEALEDDWAERLKLAEAPAVDRRNVLSESLIMQYLTMVGTSGRTGRRRIMRAILADGSEKATMEFTEIFSSETKRLKPVALRTPKRKRMNIDEGDFGDYFDGDDDEEADDEENVKGTPNNEEGHGDGSSFHDQPVSALRKRAKANRHASSEDGSSADSAAINPFGNLDAMIQRRRLLVLLTRVAQALPSDFTWLEDLLDVFTEFIRPLPLSMFSFLVSPSPVPNPHHFSASMLSNLNQMLLRPLLATAAPRYDEHFITQEKLAKNYLHHAANTSSYIDNAKVSLLLESLLRLLRQRGELHGDAELEDAVVWGINSRNGKATLNVRSKKQAKLLEDEEAMIWLEGSTKRIKSIVEEL